MTNYRTIDCIFVLLALAQPVANAVRAASYTVTDLGALGGTESFGSGLNASGQVVGSNTNVYFVPDGSCTPDHPYYPNCGPGGTWEYETRAVLWKNGAMTDLGTLGGTDSFGNDLNASGQVAGESSTPGDATTHAFLWKPTTPGGASGTMNNLGTLGGTNSYGYGINAAGQLTGASDTTGDSATRAFLWKPTTPNGTSGTMYDLGSLGGSESNGSDINASGQVSGSSLKTGDAAYRAFLWKPSTHGRRSRIRELWLVGRCNLCLGEQKRTKVTNAA